MGSCSTTEAAHTDKMGKGHNEGEGGGFSEDQIQMYKDCFKLIDINKDGTLDKNDLRGAFDNIGVLMSESELDDLMGEVGGPCNVTGMINMFQEKMAGDVTIPMSLSSRLSWPTTWVARSMSRCSSTLSEPGETRCPTLRLTTSSSSSTLMRTTWLRPRKLLASLSLSRRKRRRKRRRRRLLRPLLRKRVMMPRRRRRRRRRPPSKCTSPNVMIIRLILSKLILVQ